MNIYVAASKQEYQRARALMHELRKLGHTITHDWTLGITDEPGNVPNDDALSAERRSEIAGACYSGVMCADVFVLLVPRPGEGAGCWVELGVALVALAPRRVIAVGDVGRSAFLAHPRVVVVGEGVLDALR